VEAATVECAVDFHLGAESATIDIEGGRAESLERHGNHEALYTTPR
jgi:hypothetical protein